MRLLEKAVADKKNGDRLVSKAVSGRRREEILADMSGGDARTALGTPIELAILTTHPVELTGGSTLIWIQRRSVSNV